MFRSSRRVENEDRAILGFKDSFFSLSFLNGSASGENMYIGGRVRNSAKANTDALFKLLFRKQLALKPAWNRPRGCRISFGTVYL